MRFVAIDFETANEKRNSPCALGLTVVEKGQILEEKYWLIKPPDMRFSPINIWIHGIREEDVVNEREFNELWKEIKPYLDGAFVIAHNASFDISVLRNTLDTYNIEYPEFQYACTVNMSKNFYPNFSNHKLNTVCNILGYKFQHHHAGEDATAAAFILKNIIEETGVDSVEELRKALGITIGKVYNHGYTPSLNIGKSLVSAKKFVTLQEKEKKVGLYFSGKAVAFTGPLRSLSRGEAKDLVEKAGGFAKGCVSKKIDILVTNFPDWQSQPIEIMSNKMKKAYDLIKEGQKIKIINEEEFLNLLYKAD